MQNSSCCDHSLFCLCQYIGCSWIENKELLYPHLQLGDVATMQAKISSMETHRASVHQRLVSAPMPVQLEDETIEDDLEDRLPEEEGPEEAAVEIVVSEDEDVTMGAPYAERPPHGELTPSDPPRDEMMVPPEETVAVPLASSNITSVDSDRAAMPPPPPRNIVPLDPPPSRQMVSLDPPPPHNIVPLDPELPRIMIPLEPAPSTVHTREEASTAALPESLPPDEECTPEIPPSKPIPPTTPGGPTNETSDDSERETLLRQLDLLRLKFKQSVIPPDIEGQTTSAVRKVVERNLVNLKRARDMSFFGRKKGHATKHRHVQTGSGRILGCGGVPAGQAHSFGYEPIFGVALCKFERL